MRGVFLAVYDDTDPFVLLRVVLDLRSARLLPKHGAMTICTRLPGGPSDGASSRRAPRDLLLPAIFAVSDARSVSHPSALAGGDIAGGPLLALSRASRGGPS